MNREAMQIPRAGLVAAVRQRREQREAEIAARDARYGRERIRLTSYMENIGWPELFRYDMNAYFADPDLAAEMQLRQRIFWADNVPDDTAVGLSFEADAGYYFDLTLFGQRVSHTPEGVPEFAPHALQRDLDLAALGHFDFQRSGVMPVLLARFRRLGELGQAESDPPVPVGFPNFHRGPLDIYVQLRGYEQFVNDVAERPEKVHAILAFLADERLRFAQERQRHLGEARLPAETFVADDWVNVPFISPQIFREFVAPAYARIRAHEGRVTGFHTCGRIEALIGDLLAVFPELRQMDISGWNDVRRLDEFVPADFAFGVQVLNTVTLGADAAEQDALLDAIAAVAAHRPVSVCAQAIVRRCPTYAETLTRLNRFMARAYRRLGSG